MLPYLLILIQCSLRCTLGVPETSPKQSTVPEVTALFPSSIVERGSDLTLTCKYTSISTLTPTLVHWWWYTITLETPRNMSREDGPITPTTKTRILTIRNVTGVHTGGYVCEARYPGMDFQTAQAKIYIRDWNRKYSTTSELVLAEVGVTPATAPLTPLNPLTPLTPSQSTPSGSLIGVTLSCSFYGDEPDNVTWYRPDGSPIIYSSEEEEAKGQKVFFFSQFWVSHLMVGRVGQWGGGVYTCVARWSSHLTRNVTGRVLLWIIGIQMTSTHRVLPEHQPINLTCNFKFPPSYPVIEPHPQSPTNPPPGPFIRLTGDSRPVSPNGSHWVTHRLWGPTRGSLTQTYTLLSPSLSSSGNYTCEFEYDGHYGSSTSTSVTVVRIEGGGKIHMAKWGTTALLTCGFEGGVNPPSHIAWVGPNRTVFIERCGAVCGDRIRVLQPRRGTSHLVVRSVGQWDAGVYTCMGRWISGDVINTTVELRVAGGPPPPKKPNHLVPLGIGISFGVIVLVLVLTMARKLLNRLTKNVIDIETITRNNEVEMVVRGNAGRDVTVTKETRDDGL